MSPEKFEWTFVCVYFRCEGLDQRENELLLE